MFPLPLVSCSLHGIPQCPLSFPFRPTSLSPSASLIFIANSFLVGLGCFWCLLVCVYLFILFMWRLLLYVCFCIACVWASVECVCRACVGCVFNSHHFQSIRPHQRWRPLVAIARNVCARHCRRRRRNNNFMVLQICNKIRQKQQQTTKMTQLKWNSITRGDFVPSISASTHSQPHIACENKNKNTKTNRKRNLSLPHSISVCARDIVLAATEYKNSSQKRNHRTILIIIIIKIIIVLCVW